jgi:Pterin 4 alpha carbinolamine dehydratase
MALPIVDPTVSAVREVDWEIVELDGIKRLRRVFSLDDFAQALEFTNKVGELAEQEGATTPRAPDRMGQDDGHLVDAQNQGPASQRFRHGGENGRAVSAMNPGTIPPVVLGNEEAKQPLRW